MGRYSPLKDFKIDKKVVEVNSIDQLEFNVYRIWYKMPDENRSLLEISTD